MDGLGQLVGGAHRESVHAGDSVEGIDVLDERTLQCKHADFNCRRHERPDGRGWRRSRESLRREKVLTW